MCCDVICSELSCKSFSRSHATMVRYPYIIVSITSFIDRKANTRRNSGPVLHCTLGADKSGSQYCKMFSTQKSVLKTEIDYCDLTNFSNLPLCRSMGLQGN